MKRFLVAALSLGLMSVTFPDAGWAQTPATKCPPELAQAHAVDLEDDVVDTRSLVCNEQKILLVEPLEGFGVLFSGSSSDCETLFRVVPEFDTLVLQDDQILEARGHFPVPLVYFGPQNVL